MINDLCKFKKNTPCDINLSILDDEIESLLQKLAVDFNFKQFDMNLFP